jgi:glyoxylase-like metal-dependent hydrolase (beta-lactamase superfamily II)
MDAPVIHAPRSVAPDTDALPAYAPLPGFGILPVNAFLIHAEQPLLVDTGLPALQREFVDHLRTRVDLEALRWIWLTHTDPDHVGALASVLDEAPNARLITTYLGMGKLNLTMPIDPERVYLLNPGQRLDLGDRHVRALRPPVYDAPETTALLDERSGAFFSADAFGALMSEPADDAAAIEADALRRGAILWGSVDAPWLHIVKEEALARTLAAVSDLSPSVVLSAHLPPARGMTQTLLDHLYAVRSASEFVGPDQEALLQMLRGAAA